RRAPAARAPERVPRRRRAGGRGARRAPGDPPRRPAVVDLRAAAHRQGRRRRPLPARGRPLRGERPDAVHRRVGRLARERRRRDRPGVRGERRVRARPEREALRRARLPRGRPSPLGRRHRPRGRDEGAPRRGRRRPDPARPRPDAVGRGGDPRLRPLRPRDRPRLPAGHRAGLPARRRGPARTRRGRRRRPLPRGRGRELGRLGPGPTSAPNWTRGVSSALSLPRTPSRSRFGREGVRVDRRAPTERITLADVAARAGVSVMTVSRVVNERPGVGQRTRERVRQAIESLGYRPNIVARGLRAASSRTIGLIVPDVTNPYFPEIVRGAEDVAIEHGYTLLLANGIEDVARETESLRTFEDHLVDGVILCSPRLENQELYPLLERLRAAVLVNRRSDPRYAGSVRIDHELGARMLLRHL